MVIIGVDCGDDGCMHVFVKLKTANKILERPPIQLSNIGLERLPIHPPNIV